MMREAEKAFRQCGASDELTETVSEAMIVARDAVKESSNCKEMQECSVSRKNIDAVTLVIFLKMLHFFQVQFLLPFF
jgi:hypothetical protein